MATGDLLWCCGFEAADPAKDGLTAQTVTGGTITEVTTQAHTGSYALRVNRTGASGLSYRCRTGDTPPFPPGGAKAIISYSFWFYFASLPSSECRFMLPFGNSGAGDGTVQFTCDGSGQIRVGYWNYGGLGTATVGSAISTGAWHQIEGQVDVSGTTWTATSRLDGGTPATTSLGGQVADTIFGFEIGTTQSTNANHDVYIDDFIYVDGGTWVGNSKVVTIKPDSAASELDTTWTIGAGSGTRAAVIDEVPGAAPNDATDYITSSTASQAQRVEMTTYTLSAGETIMGVQTQGRTGSTATTGTRTIAVNLQDSSGNNGTASTWSASINGWRVNSTQRIDITKPAGGAWDQSTLDGIRLRFVKDSTTSACRLTTAWCYVAIAIAGSTTWNGSSATSIVVTPTTSAKLGRFASTATAIFVTPTSSGTRKTFATTATPIVVTPTSAGTRKALGTTATPIVFTPTTAAKQGFFASTATPIVFTETTTARLGRFGTTATAIVVTPTTSGTRKTFGSTATPVVVTPMTAGARKTFGASATPIIVTFTTDPGATHGASAATFAFALVTSGTRTTFGTTATPIVVVPTSAGHSGRFGVSATAVIVAPSSSAYVGRFGATTLGLIFLPTSQGTRTRTGATDAAIVFTFTSDGHRAGALIAGRIIPGFVASIGRGIIRAGTEGRTARTSEGETDEGGAGNVSRSHRGDAS